MDLTYASLIINTLCFLHWKSQAMCPNEKVETFQLLTHVNLIAAAEKLQMYAFNLTTCTEGCRANEDCYHFNIVPDSSHSICLYYNNSIDLSSEVLNPNPNEAIYSMTKLCLKGACNRPFSFELVENKVLLGYDDKTLPKISKDQCLEACLSEVEFICKSVEYHRKTETCILSIESRYTRPIILWKTNRNVDYYDNNCILSDYQYAHQLVAYHTMHYFTDLDLFNISLDDCINVCKNCNEFPCRSFMFGNIPEGGKICILSHHNRQSLSEIPNAFHDVEEINYYETFNQDDGCTSEDKQAYILMTNERRNVKGMLQGLYTFNLSACVQICSADPQCQSIIVQSDSEDAMCHYYNKIGQTVHNRDYKVTSKIFSLSKICLRGSCNHNFAFEVVKKKHLRGFDNKIIFNISKKKCLESCLLEKVFSCLSVEYSYPNSQCHLSSETRYTMPNVFEDSSEIWDYYENNCAHSTDVWPTKNGLESFEQCENQQVNFELMSGYRLLEMALYTQFSVDPSSCLYTCKLNKSCAYLVYDYNARNCHFYEKFKSPDQFLMLKNDSNNFYEKVCLTATIPCNSYWAYEIVFGKELKSFDKHNWKEMSFDDRRLLAFTRTECISACLNENTFICRSAEFNSLTHDCSLSRFNRHTFRDNKNFKDNPDIEYLENNCYEEVKDFCSFKRINGKTFSKMDIVLSYNVRDEDECRHRCLQETKFICRTYLTESNHCYLSYHTSCSVPFKSVPIGATNEVVEVASCFNVSISCDATSMITFMKTNKIFNGKIYAADSPKTCEVDVHNSLDVFLPLSLKELSTCNTQKMEEGIFINNIVVQTNSFVLTSGDRMFGVQCNYHLHQKVEGAPLDVSDDTISEISQISQKGSIISTQLQMKILDQSGKPARLVDLGQRLIVQIEALKNDVPSMYVKKMVAYDGKRVNNIILIEDSCPVQPMMQRIQSYDNPTIMEGYLEVFMFPGDNQLILEATVVICTMECPELTCESELIYDWQSRKIRSDSNFKSIEKEDLSHMMIEKTLNIQASALGIFFQDIKLERTNKTIKENIENSSSCFSTLTFSVIVSLYAVIQLFLIGVSVICMLQRSRQTTNFMDLSHENILSSFSIPRAKLDLVSSNSTVSM